MTAPVQPGTASLNREPKSNSLWGVWMSEQGNIVRFLGSVPQHNPTQVVTASGLLTVSQALQQGLKYCPRPTIALGATGFEGDTMPMCLMAMAVMEQLITPNFFVSSTLHDYTPHQNALKELDAFLQQLGSPTRMGMLCRISGSFLLNTLGTKAFGISPGVLSAVLDAMPPELPAHNAARYLLNAHQRSGKYDRPTFLAAKEAHQLHQRLVQEGHPEVWAAKMVRNRHGLTVST